MRDEMPGTPAGLPRNREADAWRLRAVQAERMENRGWAAAFVLGLVSAALWISYVCAVGERDAARVHVAAAEQRAERAEAEADRAAAAMVSAWLSGRSNPATRISCEPAIHTMDAQWPWGLNVVQCDGTLCRGDIAGGQP